MALKISPKQTLAIYYLVFTGKTPLQSALQPQLSPKERSELVSQKLINTFKNPKGRGICVELTDLGWLWAEENLGKTLAKSQASSEVLQALLLKLGSYLKKTNSRLSDILADSTPLVKVQDGDSEKIRSAYLRLTGGEFNSPVRIAEIGNSLPHVAEAELLNSLSRLNAQKAVYFGRLDDPQSLTEADRRYTITIEGNDKHLVTFTH